MLGKRIIPCLDVDKGRVVKGVNFVGLVDAGDPVEQARYYDAEEADELVLLDITASSDERDTMVDVVRRTAEHVSIPFTVGGGIRSVDDMRLILAAGADKVSINTSAILEPQLIRDGAERFGSQCIVVAMDPKRMDDGSWDVHTHGGRTPTGIDARDWCRRRGPGGWRDSHHRHGQGWDALRVMTSRSRAPYRRPSRSRHRVGWCGHAGASV